MLYSKQKKQATIHSNNQGTVRQLRTYFQPASPVTKMRDQRTPEQLSSQQVVTEDMMSRNNLILKSTFSGVGHSLSKFNSSPHEHVWAHECCKKQNPSTITYHQIVVSIDWLSYHYCKQLAWLQQTQLLSQRKPPRDITRRDCTHYNPLNSTNID